MRNAGLYGLYWSSRGYSATGAYHLYFYESGVDPSDYYGRYRYAGFPLRCLNDVR